MTTTPTPDRKSAARQSSALVRVCASCEWIFRRPATDCPRCGFASYGAHWAIGPQCYRLEATQERWIARALAMYRQKLEGEVARQAPPPRLPILEDHLAASLFTSTRNTNQAHR